MSQISYLNLLPFDVQEKILLNMSPIEIYNVRLSDTITEKTFQIVLFHMHNLQCKDKAFPILHSKYKNNESLDYFLIYYMFEYITHSIALYKIFKEHKMQKDREKELTNMCIYDDELKNICSLRPKENIIECQIYILNLIDTLSPRDFFIHFIFFFNAIIGMELISQIIDEKVITAIFNCKGFITPYICDAHTLSMQKNSPVKDKREFANFLKYYRDSEDWLEDSDSRDSEDSLGDSEDSLEDSDYLHNGNSILYCKDSESSPVFAKLEYFNSNSIPNQLLNIFTCIINMRPFDKNSINFLIRSGAPFKAIFDVLLQKGNAYLIKFFLSEWKLQKGKILSPDCFNLAQILKCKKEYHFVIESALNQLFDQFTFPCGASFIDAAIALNSTILFNKIFTLDQYSSYNAIVNVMIRVDSIMNKTKLMEPLIINLNAFLCSKMRLNIKHKHINLICRIAEKYWTEYSIVPKMCLKFVNRISEESLKYLDLLSYKLPVELFDAFLIKICDANIENAIENILSGVVITKYVGKLFISRLLELRPESFNIKLIKNISLLDEYIWRNAIMSDKLRKYFGEEFLINNCNSVKTVKLALQYDDIRWSIIFPLLYQNSLVSYNHNIIKLLENSKHYTKKCLAIPEDYEKV
jgi:hypothetical protein